MLRVAIRINVLVRDIQRHPVTHAYLHADFYAVDMTEMQEVSVQVVSTGRPEALALDSWCFSHWIPWIFVRCPPIFPL